MLEHAMSVYKEALELQDAANNRLSSVLESESWLQVLQDEVADRSCKINLVDSVLEETRREMDAREKSLKAQEEELNVLQQQLLAMQWPQVEMEQLRILLN